MSRRLLSFLAMLVLGLALAWLNQDSPASAPPARGPAAAATPKVATPPAASKPTPTPASERAERAPKPAMKAELRTTVRTEVVSYGKVVYRGPVDLAPTIARIEAGERHPHRNDGSVFKNRERRLPKKPRGYYREYVHPTRGQSGPGPQRIVVGRGGEWYYTPDHYESFVPLHQP